MSRLLTVIFVSLISVSVSNAQQKEPYEYGSEFIWGINKNTAGGWIGGFVFKYGSRINDRLFQSFGLELMNVKHPKEFRYNNSGSFFIYGKLNYLYAVRLQYGRELILFKKAEEQGVEIKVVAAAGPTLGIVNPYYVNVLDGNGSFVYTKSVPHNPGPDQTFQDIFGPGKLFQGMKDAVLYPGANIKGALNFEMGTVKSHITGIELGFLVEAYAKKVPLLKQAEDKSLFPTAFITLYYGSRK